MNKLAFSLVVLALMVVSVAFNAFFFSTLAEGSPQIVVLAFALVGAVFDISKKLSAQAYGTMLVTGDPNAGQFKALWFSLVTMSLVAMFGFWAFADHQRKEAKTIESFGFQAAKSEYEQAQKRESQLAHLSGVSVEELNSALKTANENLRVFLSKPAMNSSGQNSGKTIAETLSLGWKSYIAKYGPEKERLLGLVKDAMGDIHAYRQYQSAANSKTAALNSMSAATTTGGENMNAPVFKDMAFLLADAKALMSENTTPTTASEHDANLIRIFWTIVISLITEWIIFMFSKFLAQSDMGRVSARQEKTFGFVPPSQPQATHAEYNNDVPRYVDGGAVPFTGYAYVDGTEDMPEYMFSAPAVKNAGGVSAMDELHEEFKRGNAKGRKPSGPHDRACKKAALMEAYAKGDLRGKDGKFPGRPTIDKWKKASGFTCETTMLNGLIQEIKKEINS